MLSGDPDARWIAQEGVARMCDRMTSRGPDAAGSWSDSDMPLVLGHRRLAVIDLDARANQPMTSADGGLVIVFNGEIYNFRELRRELADAGESFRTQSDTEVLLALYARHGTAMLPKLRGMFAFVIWDRKKRELFAARDPYGIKPLYIATVRHGFLVASQVKALLETGLVSAEPDAMGQAGFWLTGSVMEPRTWFRDIRCIEAGAFAVISPHGGVTVRRWHDIADDWREARGAAAAPGEVREIVRAALVRSVQAHLVADVPIGVFLSGGIDSSAVAALMRETGANALQGITLGYDDFAGTANDEVPVASRFAAELGIAHHVRVVRRAEFEEDLPRIFAAMDQPSVDGINTWYASKAVAELRFKVVMSGVGGDELFHGYSSFRQLPRLVSYWNGVSHVPGVKTAARWFASWQARYTANARWKLLPSALGSIEGAWFMRRGLFGPDELPGLMGPELAALAMDGFDAAHSVRGMTGSLPSDRRIALSQIESMTYLRNQLLRDSDWASMDHSVELRTPLVDAWLLRELRPILAALGRFENKRLLAEAPRAALGDFVTRRKKSGFGIPVQRWLREMGRSNAVEGMSRSWAMELTKHVYARS